MKETEKNQVKKKVIEILRVLIPNYKAKYRMYNKIHLLLIFQSLQMDLLKNLGVKNQKCTKFKGRKQESNQHAGVSFSVCSHGN